MKGVCHYIADDLDGNEETWANEEWIDDGFHRFETLLAFEAWCAREGR